MILKSQRENRKKWASRNADVIASSVWWVPILAKRYIKIWCMLCLLNLLDLKHLETNWDVFFGVQILFFAKKSRGAADKLGIKNVSFVVSTHARACGSRGHTMDMNYRIWKWIVLYYLPSYCSVISSDHLRKDSGVKINARKNLNQKRLRLSINSIH